MSLGRSIRRRRMELGFRGVDLAGRPSKRPRDNSLKGGARDEQNRCACVHMDVGIP